MNKSVKIYLIFLVIVIIGVVVVDTNSPKPINWSPTYSISDKIPFGLYVFNQELKEILKPDTLQTINVTPYEYFDDYYNYDEDEPLMIKDGKYFVSNPKSKSGWKTDEIIERIRSFEDE